MYPQPCDLKFSQQRLSRTAFHFPCFPSGQGLPLPQKFSTLGLRTADHLVCELVDVGREGEQYVHSLIQWIWGGPVIYMLPKTPGEALALTLRHGLLTQESELGVPQRSKDMVINAPTAWSRRQREEKGLSRVIV